MKTTNGKLASMLVVAFTIGWMCRSPLLADVVVAWGENGLGQLGDGTENNRISPVAVSGLINSVTAIAAGSNHSLAIQNGRVYAWGLDNNGQLDYQAISQIGFAHSVQAHLAADLPPGATAISGGGEHTLAIVNGALYTWGSNSAGQLGDGTHVNRSPEKIMNGGVTAISGGTYYSMAISSGALYAWGANDRGQLGSGTTNGRATPQVVAGFSTGVTLIAAGANGSMAVQNGALYTWGSATQINQLTPVSIPELSNSVTAIAAGLSHSLAVMGGKVYAWGSNVYGQVGDGTTLKRASPVEVDPADLNDITAVAASVESSYALSADGTLWVWGHNEFGQLGLGTNVEMFDTPQRLFPPAGYVFTSIDADTDGYHAVATLAALPEPGISSVALLGSAFLIRRRSIYTCCEGSTSEWNPQFTITTSRGRGPQTDFSADGYDDSNGLALKGRVIGGSPRRLQTGTPVA